MTTRDTSAVEESSSGTSSGTESPVARLKQQRSFEERYANIINQQILENTINKEVLQRQLQVFFPISHKKTTKDRKYVEQSVSEVKVDIQEEASTDKYRNCLEKLETLDIKDKEAGACD